MKILSCVMTGFMSVLAFGPFGSVVVLVWGICSRAASTGTVVVIASGKGGVGKTTSAASFAFGLAEAGHKTCVIDFDIGLRNLDLHLVRPIDFAQALEIRGS